MNTIGVNCDLRISNAGEETALLLAPKPQIDHNTAPTQSSEAGLLLLNETLKITVRGGDNLLQPNGQAYTLTRAQVNAAIQAMLSAAAEGNATFTVYTYGYSGTAIIDDASLLSVQTQISQTFDDHTLLFARKPTLTAALTLGGRTLILGGQVLTL